MADSGVNIRITATDKASAQINNVKKSVDNLGKVLPNVAQQFGVLSGAAGRLSSQLGNLIGMGGLAGVAAGLVTLAVNADSVADSLADWATGLSKVRDEYDKLNPKLEEHLRTITAIRNQRALVGLAGSARTAVQAGQAEKALADIQAKIDIERSRLTGFQTRKAAEAAAQKAEGAPFAFLNPEVEQGIKDTTTEIRALEEEARKLRETAGLLNDTMGFEKSEEGKKRLKELAGILEQKQEQNYKNMQQINDAVAEEIELVTKWAKERIDLERDISEIQKDIDQLGRARLEKSLGTGVTEEAIEAGLEKNAATAKKIIQDYNAGLEEQHQIFIKLNDARDRQAEQNRQQWEQMFDTIREGAGRVFDAMLTKGQSVFSSLANFAQGVLQTMLRNVFQNAVAGLMTAGSGGISRILGAAGGGGTGSAGSAAASFAGLGVPFLSKLRPGSGGAQLQKIITGPGAGKIGGFGGFAGSAAGSALTAGGLFAGTALASDAFRRGSAIEGLAGGALAGASIGTMIAPGIGTAIGAGVGAIAGLITGIFGGGAQRRAEEAAKRAAAQEAQKFAAPEAITRYGIAGGAGYSVETDLTGSIRGIGKTPTVIVNVQNQMIDARHAREAGEVIGQEVSRQLLQGGSLLSDNVAWAAS